RFIFSALLLDILAFTVILPLFPQLLRYYEQTDGRDAGSLYATCLDVVKQVQRAAGVAPQSRLDIILLGGLLGSWFALLQFLISPWIGRLSDRYGRRPILLVSMLGNAVSMFLWLIATSFPMFVLSRTIGGLTEGNVQISQAMIADVTDATSRPRGMALVGIAFSLGFTAGPPLGAYFTSLDVTRALPFLASWGAYEFSGPALFALVLIAVEAVYLLVGMPETRGYRLDGDGTIAASGPSSAKATTTTTPPAVAEAAAGATALDPAAATRALRRLGGLHCAYLFLFSGMEFTLTFLTFDRFGYSRTQQGMLLGAMGLLSAAVMGGYTRRATARQGERRMAQQGMAAGAAGLAVLARAHSPARLRLAAALLAFTSATVSSSLASWASLLAPHAAGHHGAVLGRFRSIGQLGRALGPLTAAVTYWMLGSDVCYTIGAVALALLT
ncbi:hypothetical protein CXG81DRAFT_7954, partial [Caulochytrium protostelioides]